MTDFAPLLTPALLSAATGMPMSMAKQWAEPIQKAWDKARITTPLRRAMWLAQCGHETGGFQSMVESLNYTPKGLRDTWSKRFTPALANLLGRTPEHAADQVQIAITAYGDRLGNDPATKDGWTYRGHGCIQVTGKANFRALSEWAGKDYVKHPELLAQPSDAAMAAAWYWASNDLNVWSDRGDLEAVSRIVNCGPKAPLSAIPNGMKDREARFKLALPVLKSAR